MRLNITLALFTTFKDLQELVGSYKIEDLINSFQKICHQNTEEQTVSFNFDYFFSDISLGEQEARQSRGSKRGSKEGLSFPSLPITYHSSCSQFML